LGGKTPFFLCPSLAPGAAIGEPVTPSEVHGSDVRGSDAGGQHGDHGDDPAMSAGASSDLPGGLLVAERGYRLEPGATTLPTGVGVPFSFTVTSDGSPLTRYEQSHEKELHLIAVRRDLGGFQHVHPVRAADGTWSVPLDLTPGTWRLFADFVPTAGPAAGETLTLGADIQVAGDYQPGATPAASRTATVDGYQVTLTGDLAAGADSELTLAVERDGRPVTDLEPYLGAYGHLVALRAGDLAYLHVHPDGAPGDGRTASGPDVTFHAEVPSAGQYRLFLDFKHRGVVRTAEFAVDTADGASPMRSAEPVPAQPAPQGSPAPDGHDATPHGH
jgi:hypothetical protein